MLTPLQYNQLCDDIAVLYAGLENSIIEDMTRRIVRMGYVSDSSAWQANMLMEAGMLYEDILAEIALKTGQTDRQIRELFRSAGIQSVRNDNFYYRQAGLVVPRNMSDSALQILNAGYQKCSGSLKNLTLTTANTSQQAFIQACNLAYMQTSSGTMDYQTAIRKAIQSAAGNGTVVRYPSGHTDKLDVAVRRAVLTGVGQTVRQISFQNAKDTECDLMEITAHAGARPSHAEWQGQIVSLSGRKGYLSTSDIGYGTADGFGGVNCRHDWFPFFEGVSVRAYSDERLKELAEHKTTIDGVDYSDYELSQKQRYFERQIREKKRQVIAAKASADNAPNDAAKAAALADFQKKSVQLKTAEQKLNNFLSKTGFLKDSSRTWVNGFGRSISQKAVWANKKYQQGKNPPPASPASPSVPKSPNPAKPSGSVSNSLTSSNRSGIINPTGKNFGQKRNQLPVPYKGVIHEKDLPEFNKNALQSIIAETGYSQQKAQEFQEALQEWLGGDYQSFTAGQQKEKEAVINAGLSRMGAYDGEIHRGLSFRNAEDFRQFSELEAGQKIPQKSVSSWSDKPDIAENYAAVSYWNRDSVILICENNKSAVGVRHISKYGTDESEVLAPSTTSWKVVRKEIVNKYDYVSEMVKQHKNSDAGKNAATNLLRHGEDFKKYSVITLWVEEE
ncbi:MAG: phage minor capsid protein [Oscillospiraceae bacterium]|nr:phage minor capsid protein [Oscillospiraceae bacterium]